VAGVDGLAYPPSAGELGAVCADPAGDFERLGRLTQQLHGSPVNRAPILVGYGDGAALAYAAAANAPPGTFAAVLSLGFCSQLRPARWCEGAIEPTPIAGTALQPTADLPVPWVLLHGELDTHCTLAESSGC
jgi:type IV secretory pathway VirJ component